MATFGIQMPELARQAGDGPALILPYPEAASQGFKKGAALKLSGGQVSLAATTDPVIGFAGHDASGVTGTQVLVVVATPTTIFTIPFNGATGTSQVGKVFNFVTTSSAGQLSVSSYGAIVLSASAAGSGANSTLTNSPFICIGMDPREAAGDTNGRLHVVVRYHQNGWLNANG